MVKKGQKQDNARKKTIFLQEVVPYPAPASSKFSRGYEMLIAKGKTRHGSPGSNKHHKKWNRRGENDFWQLICDFWNLISGEPAKVVVGCQLDTNLASRSRRPHTEAYYATLCHSSYQLLTPLTVWVKFYTQCAIYTKCIILHAVCDISHSVCNFTRSV